MTLFRNKWLFLAVSGLIVGLGGIFFGQYQHRADISTLYKRSDFTLVDSKQNFFHLHDLKESEFLLLVYTPDVLKKEDVIPLAQFNQGFRQGAQKELKFKVLSKVGRDLVRNFLGAAHIGDSFLMDPSGTVRDLLGLPMGREFWTNWGYALVDRNLQIYWVHSQKTVMSFEEIKKELAKALNISEK